MPATVKLTRHLIGVQIRRGKFDVLIDGTGVASIDAHETIETPVEPGHHTLQLRYGRYSSRTAAFDAAGAKSSPSDAAKRGSCRSFSRPSSCHPWRSPSGASNQRCEPEARPRTLRDQSRSGPHGTATVPGDARATARSERCLRTGPRWTRRPARRALAGHRSRSRRSGPCAASDEHFRRISGNTRLLRRAAALRLVQISAGGSLAGAAAFPGIGHRYLKASPGSAAFADDPAQFRLAVHALARQLSTTPELISYKHRRDALQDWRIDTATWQDIISQLPPTKGPFQPGLSDCKRQFASEAIWARITQGEHLLAPRIIEDQVSAGDPTWHRRRDNIWHFYLATPAKPHYAALRKILSAHADSLAGQIDHQR